MNRNTSIALVVATLVGVAVLAFAAWKTRGQSLSPLEQYIHERYSHCCPHHGCRAVRVAQIPGGWQVQLGDRMVEYRGPVLPSPINAAVACGTSAGVWCLFLPPTA